MDDFAWGFFKIIAALLLVLLNGFFVGAEFSLVKVRKTRLAELADNGSGRAQVALDVVGQLDAYLSACQLGITLASLGLGWLGEPAIATLIDPLFHRFTSWTPLYTHTISVIIAFLIITFLHIVLGELVPKSLAIQRSEAMALSTAGILRIFYRVFYPAIWSLNYMANTFLRLWGVHPANEADLSHSEEELRMLVEASQRYGHLDKMEGKLLDNVFEFSDRVVSEVMVPRQDMICFYLQDTREEVLEVFDKYGYTRYPLCDDDKDNVIGLVHIRDLFRGQNQIKETDLVQLRRDILMVPESMPISFLVQKMRSERTHMAVVADEYGGTAGLVTIEDLVEELVGEIYDEFHQEPQLITKLHDMAYEVNGRVTLDEVGELLKIELEDDRVSTIGGLVFFRLGRKPVLGDEVVIKDFVFTVTEVLGLRIMKIKVAKKTAKSE